MSHLSVIYYILYLTVALGIIVKAYLLVKTYPALPLLSYLYFLITYTILGFLKLILTYIAPQIFKITSIEALINLHTLMLFLIFPLVPMCVYFFIQFIIYFLNLHLSRKAKTSYIIFWIAMCAGFAIAVNIFKETDDSTYVSLVFTLSVLASLLFLVLSALRTLVNLKAITDHEKKRAVIHFCILHVVGLSVYLITAFSISHSYFGTFFDNLLLIGINIAPLIYLQQFLKGYSLAHPLRVANKIDWQTIVDTYKISKREVEVMYLLYEGKSNKDIGIKLFISQKTVKNHIYRIYQKIGVNTRVQFFYFIHNQGE